MLGLTLTLAHKVESLDADVADKLYMACGARKEKKHATTSFNGNNALKLLKG